MILIWLYLKDCVYWPPGELHKDNSYTRPATPLISAKEPQVLLASLSISLASLLVSPPSDFRHRYSYTQIGSQLNFCSVRAENGGDQTPFLMPQDAVGKACFQFSVSLHQPVPRTLSIFTFLCLLHTLTIFCFLVSVPPTQPPPCQIPSGGFATTLIT